MTHNWLINLLLTANDSKHCFPELHSYNLRLFSLLSFYQRCLHPAAVTITIHAIPSFQCTFQLNSHFIHKLLEKLVCFYKHYKILRHKISVKMHGLSEKMWY